MAQPQIEGAWVSESFVGGEPLELQWETNLYCFKALRFWQFVIIIGLPGEHKGRRPLLSRASSSFLKGNDCLDSAEWWVLELSSHSL